MSHDWVATLDRSKDWTQRAKKRFKALKKRKGLTVEVLFRPTKAPSAGVLDKQLASAQSAGLRDADALALMPWIGPARDGFQLAVAVADVPTCELSVGGLTGFALVNGPGRVRTWDESMAADEIALREELVVFGDHPVAGDGELTAARVHDGALELWWQDSMGDLHLLEPDLEVHFEAMIDLAGCFGWQALFAEVDLSNDRWQFYRPGLARLFTDEAGVFRGVDLAPYRARYEARGGI